MPANPASAIDASTPSISISSDPMHSFLMVSGPIRLHGCLQIGESGHMEIGYLAASLRRKQLSIAP